MANDNLTTSDNGAQKGTDTLKRGLAQMLKGGVIMDVVTPEHAQHRGRGRRVRRHGAGARAGRHPRAGRRGPHERSGPDPEDHGRGDASR